MSQHCDSAASQKMRINQGQELVIAGYTPSDENFDALITGYCEKGKLLYAARTRNGFTPTSSVEFKRLRGLQISDCPFREPSLQPLSRKLLLVND